MSDESKQKRTDVKKPYLINPLKLIKEEKWDLICDFKIDPLHINNVDENGDTVLHWAAWEKAPRKVIKGLIDQGVDLYAINKSGNTAFDVAIQKNNKEMAYILADFYGYE